jgi:hypothetical protein
VKYTLLVQASARKEFDAITDAKLTLRLLRKIEALLETPRPAGCKKLQGFRDLWRIRVGTTASCTPLMIRRSVSTSCVSLTEAKLTKRLAGKSPAVIQEFISKAG